jgi:hemerythrin-like domain-containing protein
VTTNEVSTGEAHFDGREMLMVHHMFRREFGLMPRLVRSVAARDTARTQIVADHIATLSGVLHHHHHSEDVQVWPVLHERVADAAARLVELMGIQHQEVEKAVSEVDTATQVWRASATAEDRDALADAIQRLLPPLRGHMSTEEANVVPLMEQYITATEWNRMVQAGAGEADPEGMPLMLGMIMYEGDPEIIDAIIGNMPAEIRPVIGQLAADAFATHSERIHGTPTPPRSTEI